MPTHESDSSGLPEIKNAQPHLTQVDSRKQAFSQSSAVLDEPEQKLTHQWNEQVGRLIALGFHTELNLSVKEYVSTLPRFGPHPEGTKFDVPLIIDPRVPLARQLEIGGVKREINPERIINTTPVPQKPYTIWTHNSTLYRALPFEDAMERVAANKDEVRSPFVEVVGLHVQNKRLIETAYGIEASGSFYDDGSSNRLQIPFLGYSAEKTQTRVNVNFRGGWGPLWGVLTRHKTSQ